MAVVAATRRQRQDGSNGSGSGGKMSGKVNAVAKTWILWRQQDCSKTTARRQRQQQRQRHRQRWRGHKLGFEVTAGHWQDGSDMRLVLKAEAQTWLGSSGETAATASEGWRRQQQNRELGLEAAAEMRRHQWQRRYGSDRNGKTSATAMWWRKIGLVV